jgi:hypothetical protein
MSPRSFLITKLLQNFSTLAGYFWSSGSWIGLTSTSRAKTSGPLQAGISDKDCASCKLNLILVHQVKAVDRRFALKHRHPR